MSSTVFRQIGPGKDPGKPERLFRAAICAFCSLPRPSRREVVQLDDLALPLFDSVSPEARRFAAAALSECDPAPAGLVRRLADEPISVAAPLLMRSSVLRDIDLVRLIGRHGVSHARAIARRPGLNPAIANLIRALLASAEARSAPQHGEPQDDPASFRAASAPPPPAGDRRGGDRNAEEARRHLRAMMRPSASGEWKVSGYAKLRSAALAGRPGAFELALAEALGITLLQARDIASGRTCAMLLTALRALDLGAEQAFLLAAATFPAEFAHAEDIRQFLDRFEATDREAARATLRAWQGAGMATGGQALLRAS